MANLKGDLMTAYCSSGDVGKCAKIMSFSPNALKVDTNSNSNWIEFKVHHQASNRKATKEFYISATSETIFVLDKTGYIKDNFDIYIGKENESDRYYNVYLLSSIPMSISYVTITHCIAPSFFTLHYNTRFDINLDEINSKKKASYLTTENIKVTFQNGWTNYNTASNVTATREGNIVEVVGSIKGGTIDDGTIVFNIDKLFPSKGVVSSCINYNGITYSTSGCLRLNTDGSCKIYGFTSVPKRIDFQFTYIYNK